MGGEFPPLSLSDDFSCGGLVPLVGSSAPLEVQSLSGSAQLCLVRRLTAAHLFLVFSSFPTALQRLL